MKFTMNYEDVSAIPDKYNKGANLCEGVLL